MCAHREAPLASNLVQEAAGILLVGRKLLRGEDKEIHIDKGTCA